MGKDEVKYLVFDIETVSDGRLVQRIRYPQEKDLGPKEAIERYRKEILEETEGKSDFIPWPFQLPIAVAIAKVGFDFSLLDIVTLDPPLFRPHVITRLFWEGWKKYEMPTFVTYNGRGFDLPVLELAAFRYGIRLKEWFDTSGPNYSQPRYRYNNRYHIDLYELLTNSGAARLTGGLNLCSAILGKPGKQDTTGDMVQDLWNMGEKDRINHYCICDTLDTYFVFLRSRVLIGALDLAQEHVLVEKAHARISRESQQNATLQEYLKAFQFWKAPSDSEEAFLS